MTAEQHQKNISILFLVETVSEIEWLARVLLDLSSNRKISVTLRISSIDAKSEVHPGMSYFIAELSKHVNIEFGKDYPNILESSWRELCRWIYSKNQLFRDKLIRVFLSLMSSILSQFFKTKYSYQWIFIDNNLRESLTLRKIIGDSKKAKLIVYPHCSAIDKQSASVNPPPLLSINYWLENSVLSDYGRSKYRGITYITGIPIPLIKNLPSFNPINGNVVICLQKDSIGAGFNDDEIIQRILEILEIVKDIDARCYIKPHPRSDTLTKKLAVAIKNKQLEERVFWIHGLHELSGSGIMCAIVVMSSVGLYFNKMRIPVFQLMPEKLERVTPGRLYTAMYFDSRVSSWTSDYINFGFYESLKSSWCFRKIIDGKEETLHFILNKQIEAFDHYMSGSPTEVISQIFAEKVNFKGNKVL
jgi:hypothetical protein